MLLGTVLLLFLLAETQKSTQVACVWQAWLRWWWQEEMWHPRV